MIDVFSFSSRLLHAGLEALFPSACEACSGPLGRDVSVLCDDCLNALPALGTDGRCSRCCAKKTGDGCECDGASFGENRSLFEYAVVSDLLHRMKFSRRYSFARFFGGIMGERERAYICAHDVIVPVPLHPARRRERGYDQARILAYAAGRIAGIPVADAAERVRFTRPLTLSRSVRERQETVAGAFRIHDHAAVSGKNVLLVDDVMTTGSTLSALAGAVSAAAAVRVNVLTVARA